MLLHEESPSDRQTLLTEDIKRYIFNQEWPKGLNIRMREKVDHIVLVLFRDQMVTYDGEDLQQIANMVNRTIAKLRADGVPIIFNVEQNKGDTNA